MSEETSQISAILDAFINSQVSQEMQQIEAAMRTAITQGVGIFIQRDAQGTLVSVAPNEAVPPYTAYEGRVDDSALGYADPNTQSR